MKLKLKEYRNAKAGIVKTFNEKGFDKAKLAMIYSSVPLVAGYTYIMEDNPEVDLSEEIEELVKFYKYTGIEE